MGILEREGGWDAVKVWGDVLSGGEQQRISFARLAYHRPLVGVLDEASAAVSMDVEAQLYKHCKELDITLFTISHRSSLWQFHEKMLCFTDDGHYTLSDIDADVLREASERSENTSTKTS